MPGLRVGAAGGGDLRPRLAVGTALLRLPLQVGLGAGPGCPAGRGRLPTQPPAVPGQPPWSGGAGTTPSSPQACTWAPERTPPPSDSTSTKLLVGTPAGSGRWEQVGARSASTKPRRVRPPLPPPTRACCQGSSPKYSPAHPMVRDQGGSSQEVIHNNAGGPGAPSLHFLPPHPGPCLATEGSGGTPGVELRQRQHGGGAGRSPVPLCFGLTPAF